MSEISWPTPFGYTIFCDDIRNEMDGKVTLVGIYAGEMIFNVPLPAIIPKLGFVIKYFERSGESTDPIKLLIYLPGDEENKASITFDFPYEEMRKVPPQQDSEIKDARLSGIFNLVLSPVNITQEGMIKVRAIRGEDTIRLGSLRIRTNAKKLSESEPVVG